MDSERAGRAAGAVRLLGLIPARGGSKGLPGKNQRPLLGRTLVERACDCGRASGVVSRLVVSTDDPAIAQTARQAGAEVPFLRPAELARDDTPMIDVALHALDTLARDGDRFDALLLLQPTSPLRRPDHLRRAVALLDGHDAVCSVVALPQDICPHYVMRITADGYLDYFLPEGAQFTRRQDVPLAYKRDGTIFLARTDTLRGARSFYGRRCVPLVIDPAESLSIDTADQWEAAERALRRAAQDAEASSA